MWEMRSAQRMLQNLEGTDHPGDLRVCGRINIKTDLKEVQRKAVGWIKLVPDIRAN
jgi:hypothetical protein